jgi:hypothetical protein
MASSWRRCLKHGFGNLKFTLGRVWRMKTYENALHMTTEGLYRFLFRRRPWTFFQVCLRMIWFPTNILNQHHHETRWHQASLQRIHWMSLSNLTSRKPDRQKPILDTMEFCRRHLSPQCFKGYICSLLPWLYGLDLQVTKQKWTTTASNTCVFIYLFVPHQRKFS